MDARAPSGGGQAPCGRTALLDPAQTARNLLERRGARRFGGVRGQDPRIVSGEKDFSIAWHYRTCSQELAERRVIEAKNALDDLPSAQGLSLLEGSKVLEMRPQGVDKGAATKRWLRDPAFGFLLVAGDDLTDEDMFGAAPKEAWTVHVGNGPTRARFALRDSAEVRGLLRRLAEAR